MRLPATSMQPLIFLTGPTGVGKSTWLKSQLPQGSTGILSLLVKNNRYFLDLSTQQQWPMEAAAGEADVLLVGRYRFSALAFARSRQLLLQASKAHREQWLVVDEVGPLELRGEGLAPVLSEVVTYPGPQLWVVREACLEAVRQQWACADREVAVEQWPQLETLQQLFNQAN